MSVKLHEYSCFNSRISEIFLEVSILLKSNLPSVRIEHIGSSAIEGSVSKGDLDIFVGVNQHDFESVLKKIKQVGFEEKKDTLRNESLCMLTSSNYNEDVAIQLVVNGSEFEMFIDFKNALLTDHKLVDEYNKIKRKFGEASDDEYREAKSSFIQNVLEIRRTQQLDKDLLSFCRNKIPLISFEGLRVESSLAGDEEIGEELLYLYLSGKKTAASSLVADYIHCKEDFPQVGDLWIIEDLKKRKRCIVKTVRVECHKFSEVPDYIAEAEGEGDLSLYYWNKEHVRFFSPFLEDWRVTNLEEELVITEFFEIIWSDQ